MQNDMRNRLIDLLINADVYDSYECKLCTKEDYCDYCNAEKLADYLIKNDVVPVVRCKDCKYWQEKNSKGTQCVCLCGDKDMNYGGEFYPFANDYCSYGTQKERGREK